MSASSTRAELAGVALALKLDVPSTEPFVSDHYPLHSTPSQQARIEKVEHFEATRQEALYSYWTILLVYECDLD